jgi:rubrerythrin
MIVYELLPDASNDPEGNCEREWRRSSPDRMLAAVLARIPLCPDCSVVWVGIERGENCPGCGLSAEALRDAAAFLDHRAKP